MAPGRGTGRTPCVKGMGAGASRFGVPVGIKPHKPVLACVPHGTPQSGAHDSGGAASRNRAALAGARLRPDYGFGATRPYPITTVCISRPGRKLNAPGIISAPT